jgi:hypothetical protein
MSAVLYNRDALAARSRALGSLNGIDFGVMQLDPTSPPLYGILELHFFNDQHLDELVAAASTPAMLWALVPITGGDRMLAGPLSGQVQATSLIHSAPQVLQVQIAPVGDYSRYTLTLQLAGFDPIFSQFHFRFRPGCFDSNCTPRTTYSAAAEQPAIDYLAKDYDSFRHTLIAAMMQRMPAWKPTSEAALEVVLLDLLSAAADEMSNYQDRVMQEAYWSTAQKRISLRRHARLMDYFIHEGNQSSTVLAMNFPGAASYTLPAMRRAWTGSNPKLASTAWFVTRTAQLVSGLFSSVPLYTWSDAIPGLRAGATGADLGFASFADATEAVTLINSGGIGRLLIEEWLNPATGLTADRDPQKRQVVHLSGATLLTDPLTGSPVVRVTWQPQDALVANYCFVEFIDGVRVDKVSLFHGNLVDVVQGLPQAFNYLPPAAPTTPGSYHFELNAAGAAQCRLPPAFPVLWTNTTPGGLIPSVSTVQVVVTDASGSSVWLERPDLIHSDGVTDRHFVVETDELLRSLVRFGDGTNGVALPDDAIVSVSWLSGLGADGNIGQDSLVNFDATGMPDVALGTFWNPFDVTDGRAAETPSVIRRRVPEAFLYNQARAITLADYVARAEEVPGVSNAAALYLWTGSWRTVRVVIDPAGTTTLSETLRASVENALDAVHLIGEDIEVRAPQYVPLIITVAICVASDYWIDDVAPVVESAFTNGYTPEGMQAFFNPDRWTFGQALHASQIEGWLKKIEGVEHVIEVHMTRWWDQSVTSNEVITVAPEEIVLVSNDPSRLELGRISFSYEGERG